MNGLAGSPRPKLISALPWLLLSVCLIPSALTHFLGVVLPEDDAFIIYRYVQNAVAGNGLVYNPGERVFGSTTPLYTVWLCLLKTVLPVSDIAAIGVRGNFLFFALACFGLYSFLYHLLGRRTWALSGSAYFALQPDIISVSVAGMESLMFAALCLWSFSLAVQGRLRLACVLAGLSVLTRPEGVFCMLAIAPLLNWRSFKQLVLVGLLFAAPVMLWVIPATFYYGTPVPHSVVAKSAPLYPLPDFYTAGKLVERMDWWLTRILPEIFFEKMMPPLLATITTVLCCLVFACAMFLVVRRGLFDRRFLVAAIFPAALFGFYSLSNPLMMGWYWAVPHMSFIASLIVVGAYLLNERVCADRPGKTQLPFMKNVTFVCLSGWMILVTGWIWMDTSKYAQEPFNTFSLGRDRNPTLVRIEGYRLTADWLNAEFDVYPKIAAPEIGALGYYYKGPILDTCGLVSPEALPYHPLQDADRIGPTVGTIPSELLRELQPEMIVTLRLFGEKSLFEGRSTTLKPEFDAMYQVAREPVPLLTPVWGSDSVVVLKKKSVDAQ